MKGQPVSSQEMQEIDRKASQIYKIPSLLLMENAGINISSHIFETLAKNPKIKEVKILVGPGNNGGDGLVCARQLSNKGVNVSIFLIKEKLLGKSQDFKINWEITQALSIPTFTLNTFSEEKAVEFFPSKLLIVDALFGIGLSRPIEGSLKQWINWFNQSQHPILSIDIPSGLDADHGKVLGAAIQAHKTITLGRSKKAFFLKGAKKYIGDWTCEDISLPLTLQKQSSKTQ